MLSKENSRIVDVMKQQKEAMEQMRKQINSGEPARVVYDFTEEV